MRKQGRDYDISLQAGINAAKAGRMQEALEHLKDAIIEEPQNADVWVWVAAIIDDTNKQAIFLEKALEIDPHNIPAQRGLAYLEKRRRDEASVSGEHLSDYTRPISPFPHGVKQPAPVQPVQAPQSTIVELGFMAQADHKKSAGKVPETGQQANGSKLTAVEVGLLGIVALVFCFIGLLAASALFNFDLPVGNIFGERSAITSAPYAGVFLYEDNKFFDMTQHEGAPNFQGSPPVGMKSPWLFSTKPMQTATR